METNFSTVLLRGLGAPFDVAHDAETQERSSCRSNAVMSDLGMTYAGKRGKIGASSFGNLLRSNTQPLGVLQDVMIKSRPRVQPAFTGFKAEFPETKMLAVAFSFRLESVQYDDSSESKYDNMVSRLTVPSTPSSESPTQRYALSRI
ncbi:hypothetical protein AcW2_006112 [Taiwanofungus camphoratus]|nr:hypothetical protein AcW2_006112 [Antrodia cinnamomea]